MQGPGWVRERCRPLLAQIVLCYRCEPAVNRLDRPELTLTARVIPRAGLVRLLLLLKWLWPRLQW